MAWANRVHFGDCRAVLRDLATSGQPGLELLA